MNRGVSLRLAIRLLVSCGVCSCSSSAIRTAPHRTPLLDHGIRTGETLNPIAVHCSDGKNRTFADPSALQLVTISTEDDCSSCEMHIAGLDVLYRQRRIHMEQFVLTYTPTGRRADILAAYRGRTAIPVCIDEAASLWRNTDLSHTPVTVVLKHGQIAYIDDAPLETPVDRSFFTQAVADVSKP